MDDNQIIQLIKRAHAHALPEEGDVLPRLRPSATLSDLGIPSISAMEMVAFVEAELGLEFPDDEMAGIGSIGDLISLVKKHQVRP